MSISKKLMLGMIALTSIVLVATLSLAKWSFDQGFSDFLQGLEEERLDRISRELIVVYREAGDSWRGIENISIREFQFSNSRRGEREFRPGPRLRPPPPHSRPKGAPNGPPPREKQGPSSKQNSAPPTQLFDNQGKRLMGDTIDDEHQQNAIQVSFPVIYLGEQIATLRSYNLHPLQSQLASKFATQQTLASLIIGSFSLLLAILLAYIIGKRIISPIKTISANVSELTKGNYKISSASEGKDELAVLTRDISFLAATLEQARSQKSRWFADISHELRTPLTILLGEIEAIQAGIRSFDSKQLSSIEHEVKLINRLVDDLYQLSLSDLGALKYEFKDVDISKLLSVVVDSFSIACQEKSLTLKLSKQNQVSIKADEQRLEQLVINLLNNALKYTDEGGQIFVGLEESANAYVLTVEDSHPSVPKEECEALFETLYQRNESRNRANSGAGLGLSICKNIAESHQASISASPSELGGIKIAVAFKKDN